MTLLTAALLFSCGEDETTLENPLLAKYPFLKPGNALEYSLTFNGNLLQGKGHTKILKDLGDGYLMEETTIIDEEITSTIFANDQYVAWGDDEYGYFPLIFLNPKVGHTWTSPYVDDFDGVITRTIVETGITYETQAGKFANCSRVKETISEDKKILRYYYVSPKIGMIQFSGNGFVEDENGRRYFEESTVLQSKNF